MLSDIDIAQAAKLKPIVDVAQTLDIATKDLIPYGHSIAKLSANFLKELHPSDQLELKTDQTKSKTKLAHSKVKVKPNGKLILVTAISPTPAGEGKTTTTIGLADALNHLFRQENTDKHAMVCIREPSLGPVFGIKGGATGGGYAQVVPMENINLHFTGDFHAITSANNLLAALIDNHIHHGNLLNIKEVTWRRCMDMNDRALRHITTHDAAHTEHDIATSFNITVASEVMAIFCLAEDLDDLKTRLGNIQVATNMAGKPILASDLQAQGAMTVLLKDAFQPNLVQTLEHTPALIHGGPFANIAHGCNSVVATKTALKLADYVVTEAGFGADLGAEKFFDIKCRKASLQPDLVVIVATIRALKYHGGATLNELNKENIAFLNLGMANLIKHLTNLHQHFGMQVLVAINHFTHDTQLEIDTLKSALAELGFKAIVCKHWADGGAGAVGLARSVVDSIANTQSNFKLLYPDSLPLIDKLNTIATKIYGAAGVKLSEKAAKKLTVLEQEYAYLPICIAKTQYSFSSDASIRGAPTEHHLQVEDLHLSRGAGFVVAICGKIMTMPGLPKQPTSQYIDVNASGNIVGLS
ncbi:MULTISPECIES: formate--tetrahydrofolate ligase [Methylotenera]|uniref:formate--tetrahydrofolate ligase n=1 Tax=Methylotenera TaxID=359407 RepID=UPI0003764C24|nr:MULTISPECIES: formate--tetrahydrofolate ligase [Methylotenera]